MKQKLSMVAFLLALALSMQSVAVVGGAKPQASVGKSGGQLHASGATATVAAIVELESVPVVAHQKLTERLPRRVIDFESPAARSYEAQLETEHASFRSRAVLISPGLRVRTELRRLANAVSIEATPTEIVSIAAMPGVRRVEVVKEYVAMTDASVPLINAPAIWTKLGGPSTSGQGMKIAILDTGIDISNPLFSDAGFTAPAGFPRANNGNEALTNNKVIVAKSFVNNEPSAKDENGHGTNVAGIAAGNSGTVSPIGALSGVAPRAYLGNYRVLGTSGSGRTDLIGRAVEEATADGFDVISMSLGSQDPPTATGFLESVIEQAVVGGVTVVVAAGNNDGTQAGQEMTIRSPGISPSAITVGAASNAHVIGPLVSVNGPEPVASNLMNIASSSGTAVTLDNSIVALSLVDVDPAGRACGALPANSLNGKVALIERGGCNFSVKINNASAAGAKAVVIFNNDPSEGSSNPGEELPTMITDGTTIPSVMVVRSRGIALRAFAAAHPSATLSIAAIGGASATPDLLASFSALGPSVIEGLKPDVSAPGTNIYSGAVKTGFSSGVVNPSGFDSVSGTSQATPHVAGAAALIKQLNPSFSPALIKSVLISSATPEVFTAADPVTRVGVLATGGGRIDLARAGVVSATFSPASLSFGINKLKKKDVTLDVDLQITSLVDGQSDFAIGVEQLDPGDGVSVTASVGSVSLARGETKTVTITMAAILGSKRRDYTGYVTVTGGGQTLHVPYWVKYVKKKS